jgi:hypothetical protein
MIAGTWVEGMYLVTQAANEKSNPELTERIGEQKVNLNNLLLILDSYKNQSQVLDIINSLNELKEIFDGVEITYEIGEPETVEQGGMIMIVQNEKSVVNITDDQLNKIINKTKQIRNKLILV